MLKVIDTVGGLLLKNSAIMTSKGKGENLEQYYASARKHDEGNRVAELVGSCGGW